MQALSGHYRSFAIDLWGFGDSSKNADDYSVESHVAMLDGFLDKMGIARPFTLVGHSLGAFVAMRYARATLGMVERIAAIAVPLSQQHVNGHLVGRDPESVIDRSKSRFGNLTEVVMGLEKANAHALSQSIAEVPQLKLSDELQDVECPILLVFGSRDPLIKPPEAGVNGSDSASSDRQCVVLEDCGHFPMLEQPAVFNRLLREYIESRSPTTLEPKNYWQRRTR